MNENKSTAPATWRAPTQSDDAEGLMGEMVAQARLGHKQFCVGIHPQTEDYPEQAEWEDWSETFARLAKRIVSQTTLNESPSGQGADDYHVRIIHKETRFGVEEHWCDLGKIERFLNGYYANVRPGDAIVVTVPEPVSAPTGRQDGND